MELLFFISGNDQLRALFDSMKKQQIVETFTAANVLESQHFINDLQPSLILCEKEGLSEEDISLLDQYSSIPVVFLVDEGESFGDLSIQKPFSPLDLIKELEGLRKSFLKKG